MEKCCLGNAVSEMVYRKCCIENAASKMLCQNAVSKMLYRKCCIENAVSEMLCRKCCIENAVSHQNAVSDMLYRKCCLEPLGGAGAYARAGEIPWVGGQRFTSTYNDNILAWFWDDFGVLFFARAVWHIRSMPFHCCYDIKDWGFVGYRCWPSSLPSLPSRSCNVEEMVR